MDLLADKFNADIENSSDDLQLNKAIIFQFPKQIDDYRYM